MLSATSLKNVHFPFRLVSIVQESDVTFELLSTPRVCVSVDDVLKFYPRGVFLPLFALFTRTQNSTMTAGRLPMVT